MKAVKYPWFPRRETAPVATKSDKPAASRDGLNKKDKERMGEELT
jgi:hypothetical protein